MMTFKRGGTHARTPKPHMSDAQEGGYLFLSEGTRGDMRLSESVAKY